MKTKEDYEENKSGVIFDYYPESMFQYSKQNLQIVKKIESDLSDIVLQKSTKSMTNLVGAKREFIM